ncbi:hypothetical protein DV737_g3817, partial [Chaetothyriales sp. CBS 132003]
MQLHQGDDLPSARPSLSDSNTHPDDAAPPVSRIVSATVDHVVAPPTHRHIVELNAVHNGVAAPDRPLEQDIMQCARIGALEHIQKMVESGSVGAGYADGEGITPLHWAAINNQYAVCKYLIGHGADVNAKGGESGATPAMWAAQRCHYYIVHLLLQHGADALATDGQGYNILHLATIDGNTLLLILLLHQHIPVDVPDPHGHTALMWAGYKGWPACADLLLRWGADVNAVDDNAFTPLHWALVRGMKPCLDKLVEYDADRFAKTGEGKTPAVCAHEMNTARAWHRSLADHGYGPDGNVRTLPLNLQVVVRNKRAMSRLYFLCPFFLMWLALFLIGRSTVYVSVPLTIGLVVGAGYVLQYVASFGPVEFRQLHKTPYLAGVFAASLFFVGLAFFFRLLPTTYTAAPVSSLVFALVYASTTYFYVLCMVEDPGYVPKLSSRNQQRAVIEELFRQWKFDHDNFCTQCLIRRPLRSKHCRRCGRCVAKQDHHCPWIYSCVANNNLRHFFIYILSLELGLFLYLRLVLVYLAALPPPPNDATCNLVPADLCTWVLRDPWTVAVTLWGLIQLVWVTMLIVVQSVQVAKNMTTTVAGAAGAVSAAAHQRGGGGGCWAKLKRTIGLDVFLATASDASKGKMRSNRNPFSRGVIGNCSDFWCDPAPLFGQRRNGDAYLGGQVVNYTTMYQAPLMQYRGGGAGSAGYEQVAHAEEGEDE